ncbi:MAG: hypothetical protein Q3Y08_01130, partial [Butyricicoccus sp.]|nr:hypothetical protein [Butyricicoccus sp.]
KSIRSCMRPQNCIIGMNFLRPREHPVKPPYLALPGEMCNFFRIFAQKRRMKFLWEENFIVF